jgi:hypothetical protein
VLNTIEEMLLDEKVEDRFPKSKSGDDLVSNWNYYFLRASTVQHGTTKDTVFDVAGNMITKRISTDGVIVLSEENVKDILVSLMGKTISSPYFTSAESGAVSSVPHQRMEILREKKGMFGGLEISREFLNTRLKESYLELLESCIRSTMEKPKDKGALQRATLGCTLRFLKRKHRGSRLETPSASRGPGQGEESTAATSTTSTTVPSRPEKDRIYPQLLHVMEIRPLEEEPIAKMSNDAYRRFGHLALVHGKREEEKTEVAREIEVTGLDDMVQQAWLARVGYVNIPKPENPQPVYYLSTGLKLYPEKFDRVYLNKEDGYVMPNFAKISLVPTVIQGEGVPASPIEDMVQEFDPSKKKKKKTMTTPVE